VVEKGAEPRVSPARRTLLRAARALTANFVRNLWSYAIIFCGHFPDQAYTFTEEEVKDETRGGWYVRQLLGAANIDGSSTFHVMSGNLSYQARLAERKAGGGAAAGLPLTPLWPGRRRRRSVIA